MLWQWINLHNARFKTQLEKPHLGDVIAGVQRLREVFGSHKTAGKERGATGNSPLQTTPKKQDIEFLVVTNIHNKKIENSEADHKKDDLEEQQEKQQKEEQDDEEIQQAVGKEKKQFKMKQLRKRIS